MAQILSIFLLKQASYQKLYVVMLPRYSAIPLVQEILNNILYSNKETDKEPFITLCLGSMEMDPVTSESC